MKYLLGRGTNKTLGWKEPIRKLISTKELIKNKKVIATFYLTILTFPTVDISSEK